MEEHAKELEHDLRENIDLLQNQLREVRIPLFFSKKTIIFSFNRKNDKSNNINTPSVITNERY